MWRGAKLRINTGWMASMTMSTLLVLVLLFIAADLCQIGVILISFFFRGGNWYSEKLTWLIQDPRAESWLNHWLPWLQKPGRFQYTTLSQIGNRKWESFKSVSPSLLQRSERGSKETPGRSRRPSWFCYHTALWQTPYIFEGRDYTLSTSASIGNGKSETIVSNRSQFSITEVWPQDLHQWNPSLCVQLLSCGLGHGECLVGPVSKWKSLSRVQLFVTPWSHGLPGSSSMEFSRQEYWSGLPSLLQYIFPTQGLNPDLLHCRHILYHLSHQEAPVSKKKANNSIASSLWMRNNTSKSITNQK